MTNHFHIMDNKKYLPSHKRATNPPPMQLTERDKRVVLAVYRYRLLSSHQIEALLFGFPPDKPHSKRSVCQRRLQLLYHHGYLDRLPLPVFPGEGRRPCVYVLDHKGADLVAAQSGLDRADLGWRPQYNELGVSFIQHMLTINDVRLILELLNQGGAFSLSQWYDDAQFRSATFKEKVPQQTHGTRIARKYPDGYFKLHVPGMNQPASFFLEVDNGTMKNKAWKEKIEAYIEFRSSGRSEQYYGTRNFRLLTITTTSKRLNNLKRTTEKAGGNLFFWFTTQSYLNIWQPEIFLNPIWKVIQMDGLKRLLE